MWIMVVLSGLLGFGLGGLLVSHTTRERRLPSPVEELISQAGLLPVKSIFAKKGDAYYNDSRTVELEGGIRMVSTGYNPDMADLYHNDVMVRLTDRQRARLGTILNERITAGALDSVNTKLLEP